MRQTLAYPQAGGVHLLSRRRDLAQLGQELHISAYAVVRFPKLARGAT